MTRWCLHISAHSDMGPCCIDELSLSRTSVYQLAELQSPVSVACLAMQASGPSQVQTSPLPPPHHSVTPPAASLTM